MASRMRRPPAVLVYWPREEPRRALVTAARNFGEQTPARGGEVWVGGHPMHYGISFDFRDYRQVQPVNEQPKLILSSAFQPIYRWRPFQVRRYFMTMSPRFTGRHFYAGKILNQFAERTRMTGQPAPRPTYVYPASKYSPPQLVVLGQPKRT